MSNRKKRTFKLIGGYSGRYTGTSPLQAARKAFTQLAKHKRSRQIRFGIQECTRGGKCKKYYYIGKRRKLKTPRVVQIGGSEVTYNYETIVHRDKAKKCEECSEESESEESEGEESEESESEESESEESDDE